MGYPSYDFTFERFRAANVERCNSGVFNHSLESWSPAMWACALAGEVGELCNLIKKEFRGMDGGQRAAIENEIADVLTYLDLLAARYGIKLDDVARRKFNIVSERVGSDVFI